MGSGCPIEGEVGHSVQGPGAAGTCTMGVGDSWCWSHTHISEGARPKVSSQQLAQWLGCGPSAGPACISTHVCSLPPIL